MRCQSGEIRLFVAAWPDTDSARQMAALAVPWIGDGRAVTTPRLHLTLAFVGAVDPRRVGEYAHALAPIRCPCFGLKLDWLGYWRRSRVLWLGPHTPSIGANRLASEVATALAGLPGGSDIHRWRAHVTLARNCRSPGHCGPVAAVDWKVDHFSLVASHLLPNGAQYRRLASWSLAPKPFV